MNKSEHIFPLSPMQEGILFESLHGARERSYFQQMVCTFKSPVTSTLFRQAWQEVIQRHTILRTGFQWDAETEKYVQVVHADPAFDIAVVSLEDLPGTGRQQKVEWYLDADRQNAFDLKTPPLFRCTLISAGNNEYEFVWSYHHVVLDGWSVAVVLKEVVECYDALSSGNRPALKEPGQYSDYIHWLLTRDQSKAETAWRPALAGLAPQSLWTDDKGPGQHLSESELQEIEICLDAGLTLRIHSFARGSRVTTGTVIQAAWGIVLSRFAGSDHVTFGSVATLRPSNLPEPTVGLFTTIIPSRIRVIPDKPLAEWLQEFQTDEVKRRQWGFVSLRQLREWSGLPKDQALFDSVLVYQNYPRFGPSILNSDRLTVSRVQTLEQTHYPLVLTAIPTTGLTLKLTYLTNRYNARLISKLLAYLHMTLSLMADGEATLVRELFALIPADQELIETANDTRTAWDSTKCLHQLFEEQVQVAPDAIAATDHERHISYGELNKRANQVARLLRSFGADAEVPVGVCLERSVHTLVALLAIYKAGGVYVSLDPSSPALYLSHIVEDTGIRIVLTDSAWMGCVPEQNGFLLCLDSDPRIEQQEAGNLEIVISSRNLAYIMYTSGSTGTAKGVAVEQKQFLNRLWWMWNRFPFRPHELCCQRTSLNFSVSMWEFLGPVLRGTAILIASDSITRDANAFIHFLSEHAPTRVVVVPSLLRVLLETELDLPDKLRALRLWTSCGEPLAPDLLREFRKRMPHATLLNQYGASELNDVCYYDTSTWDDADWRVPAGQPIHNLRILPLDNEMNLCPAGVPGEIHIASINPARGYLNQPALTAERFIPDPYSDVPGSRLYKTGDLGRWSEEGILEHLGRKDNEIKIRGARVNIHGIEAILHSHPAIQGALVTVQESRDRDKYLVAHLVLKQPGTHGPADFRNFLAGQVPAYIVPAIWNLVEKFRYLPNGKVDRKAMSAAFAEKPMTAPERGLPATTTEKLVCQIWAAVLEVQVVLREDNFFDLGGNSLQATRTMSKIGARSGVELPVQLLFDHPRVMELATAIDKIVLEAESTLRKHLMEEIQQLSDEQVAQELYKLRAGSTSA